MFQRRSGDRWLTRCVNAVIPRALQPSPEVPMASRPGRRVAIVAGLRTPFVKVGTAFKDLSALELGRQVVAELVQRAEVPLSAIDQIVFGTVIPSVQMPNIAREVGLPAGVPKHVDAHAVVRQFTTSSQATTPAAGPNAL